MRRVILHIDMNSYFASAAAQANPFLRGKAFGVGGKPGTRGIIAAASREAKLRGVKTAMNAYEALRICPELEIIHGDPRMYSEITNRFLRIFRRHTEEVEVFSLDEAFLDVTGWVRDIDGAVSLVRTIKAEMRAELGDQLTCSVGIAENKLLAKLGSDLKKPDGITVLTRARVAEIWPTLPVTELCGIAGRLGARLEARFGVRTAAELGAAPLDGLIDEFGPVMGYHLHLMGRGEDPSPVISTVGPAKSYSHSYTLPRDLTDREALRTVLFALAEKVCRRMREDEACGRHVSAYVRYGDFTGQGGGATLKNPIDDGLALFREGWRVVRHLIDAKPVRLLGVGIGDIMPRRRQLSIFAKDEKRRRAVAAADATNGKWGERTVEPAATLGTVLKRHVSGFHHALPVHLQRAGRGQAPARYAG